MYTFCTLCTHYDYQQFIKCKLCTKLSGYSARPSTQRLRSSSFSTETCFKFRFHLCLFKSSYDWFTVRGNIRWRQEVGHQSSYHVEARKMILLPLSGTHTYGL